MITRDSRGRTVKSHRSVNTRINAELLIGHGWEEVAYAELLKHSIEIGAYHSQLEGKPGYEETGQAVELLKAACDKLLDEYADTEQ